MNVVKNQLYNINNNSLFILQVNLNIYTGYQMSVCLILNLLNEWNKSTICEPLASIILPYSTIQRVQ